MASAEAEIRTVEPGAVERREQEVREWLQGMPFVRTLGITTECARQGAAVLHLRLREEASFAPDGGFPAATIGALIDVCAGAAVASRLPSGQVVATVDFSMKMLTPLPGPVATASARALRVGRSSAAASVEVRPAGADGEPYAVGLVSLRPIRRDARGGA